MNKLAYSYQNPSKGFSFQTYGSTTTFQSDSDPMESMQFFVNSLGHLNVDVKTMWKEIDEKRTKFFSAHAWEKHVFMPFAYWLRVFHHMKAFDPEYKNKICSDSDLFTTDNKFYFGSIYQYMFTFMAIASWRVTKGVYKFDEAFTSDLLKTNFKSGLTLSSELFYRLPEWCCYIKTPRLNTQAFGLEDIAFTDLLYGCKTSNATSSGHEMHGMYVFLDKHVADNKHVSRVEVGYNPLLEEADASLVICVDTNTFGNFSETVRYPKFQILRIALGDWTLEKALSSAINGMRGDDKLSDADIREKAKKLMPLLSLVLYLCAANSHIVNSNNKSIKDRPKLKLFISKTDIPRNVSEWSVGERTGSALSLSAKDRYTDSDDMQGGCGIKGRNSSTIKMHWRRAHWQSFHTGKGRATLIVKWISPILVNAKNTVDVDNMPIVKHSVSGEVNSVSELSNMI